VSAAQGPHKVGDYRGPARPEQEERERLGHLAATLDAGTQRRMRALGIASGWRCLEVGAAEGSMVRWMAGQVGAEGRVVAGDIDLRFLSGPGLPNVEVRELDIRSGTLEEDAYDLAYCRTLLLHLPDPNAALSKLSRSLRPGGWLLVEDSDLCVHTAADPDHPDAELFESFHRRVWEHLRAAKVFDTRFGRTLPARMRELGLEEHGFEASASFQSGGSPGAELQRRNFGADLGPMLVEGGVVDRDELERVLALYADASFGYLSGLNVASWGRKAQAGDGPGRSG
jgi:SAM-dependent methyltransferase